MPNRSEPPAPSLQRAKLSLAEMIRATEQLWERAGPDVDRSPVTKADFDALWEQPHGDFSLTDIAPALTPQIPPPDEAGR